MTRGQPRAKSRADTLRGAVEAGTIGLIPGTRIGDDPMTDLARGPDPDQVTRDHMAAEHPRAQVWAERVWLQHQREHRAGGCGHEHLPAVATPGVVPHPGSTLSYPGTGAEVPA